jgi:tol-pal system protein YbgF
MPWNMPRALPAYLSAVALAGCVYPVRQGGARQLLPEIDIVELKDNADEALRLAREAERELKAIDAKLAHIESRLAALGEEPSGVSPARLEEIEERLALLDQACRNIAGEVLPRDTAESRVLAQRKVYNAALRAFNDRSYDKALKLFNELLDSYPTGRYSANARYWAGECLYALGRYTEAVASFQGVLRRPASTKTEDALLKMGLSYLKLGNKTRAKETLRELIRRFPDSEYVPRAKGHLENLR